MNDRLKNGQNVLVVPSLLGNWIDDYENVLRTVKPGVTSNVKRRTFTVTLDDGTVVGPFSRSTHGTWGRYHECWHRRGTTETVLRSDSVLDD